MDINWNVVASDLTTQVLRVIVPVLVALILKWAIEIWRDIKRDYPRLSSIIMFCAELGFSAAEEFFRNTECVGDEKMRYAIATALKYLQSVYGLTTDEETMHDAIVHYGVDYGKFSWCKEDLELKSDDAPTE